MSNFQDTFTKNETIDDLEYDDAASYTFFGSILFILGIVLFLNIFNIWRRKPKFDRKKQRCKTQKIKRILDDAENEFYRSKKTGFFYCKIMIVVVFVYLFFICVGKASVMKQLKTFDPYEILDVGPTDNDKVIKKSYRKLAILYHPDKNPDDPDAAKKFMLINKAYRCLTDPEVKEICKKTGNPDGSNSFKVGIALPNPLLEKKNRALILSIFFLVILIIIPTIVWLWYSENEKYSEHGVSNDSLRNCFQFIKNESVTMRNIIEMCASSVEMIPLFTVKTGQGEDLSKLVKLLEKDVKLSVNINKARYFKPFYLIVAYMQRLPITDALKDDLRYIHKKVP